MNIKHMVDRFLGWKLPDNFAPDGGISFVKVGNAGTVHEYKHSPSGTNLLDATQATAMVEHMVAGLDAPVAFDGDDKVALQSKVSELNAELARIGKKYGTSIRMRPGARFNTEDGYAAVHVEIETGVLVLE